MRRSCAVLIGLVWMGGASAGEVVLNEVFPYLSVADQDREWVELLNVSGSPVDVSGWRVEGAITPGSYREVFTVPAGVSLAPGERVVIGGTLIEGVPESSIKVVQGDTLGNAQGTRSHAARLVTSTGGVVDVVAYGSGNGPGGGYLDEDGVEIGEERLAPVPVVNRSLARIPDGVDTNDGAADFQVLQPPRPGRPNEVICPAPGGVVINELDFDPPGADANKEWVELIATGADPVDLSGWAVEAGLQPTTYARAFTLPPGTVLSPGELLVVAGELAVGLPAGALVQPQGATFGNARFDSDGARLVNDEGCVIDVVVYGPGNAEDEIFLNAWGDPVLDAEVVARGPEGHTLGRYPDGYNTGIPADDFFLYPGPTPGLPNPPPTSPGDSGDRSDTGIGPGETGIEPEDSGLWDTDPQDTDVWGNGGEDTDPQGPHSDEEPATPAGVVVLNELLVELTGSDQDREWVELLNVSSEPWDLSGWRVERATSPGSYGVVFTVPEGTWLAPWERVVVGGLDIDGVPQDAIRVSQGAQMGNASGTFAHAVRLVDQGEAVLDVVVYGPGNGGQTPHLDEQGAPIEDDRIGPRPGANRSLARIPDGTDTDNSAEDFQVLADPRPGLPNEIICPAPGEVVINELAYDPPGADANKEWVELVVTGSAPVDLSGWVLEAGLRPSTYSTAFTLPAGTVLAPGAFLVVGGELALDMPVDAVLMSQGATFGNATNNSDGARLLNDEGCVIDVVVYGDVNEPGHIFVNEWGEPVEDADLAPRKPEGGSIGRYPDGADTDVSADDFFVYAVPSPGLPNPSPGGGPGDTDTGDTDSGDTDPDDTGAGDTDGEAEDSDTDLGDTDQDSDADADAGDTDDSDPGVVTPAGVVVLNELLVEVTGSDQDKEWVELLNVSSEPWDLSGWRVERATSPGSYGVVFTVPSEVSLEPGERVVIGGLDIEDVPADGIRVEQGSQMGNANGSYAHAVRLVDGGGAVLDVVVYGPGNGGRTPFVDEQGVPIEEDRIGPRPGANRSLARIPDGTDTDDSASDFQVLAAPRPGLSNDGVTEPGDTDDTGPGFATPAGVVVLNELLVELTGSDQDREWVELLNVSSEPWDLSGWRVERATSPGSYGVVFTVPDGTDLDPGARVVLGGLDAEDVPADALLVEQGAQMGNASGTYAHAVRLVDGGGAVLDVVVYGPGNVDRTPFVDEQGVPIEDDRIGPRPGANRSLARIPDGTDTDDSASDFQILAPPRPGRSNDVICPDPGGVLINELGYDPPGPDANKEWVELVVSGPDPVDVSGWLLEAALRPSAWGLSFTVPDGTVIAPGEHLVVSGEDAPGMPADALLMPQGATWGNAGSNSDAARIRNDEGCVIDVVVYGEVNEPDEIFVDRAGVEVLDGELAPKSREGGSIGRYPDGADTGNQAVDFAAYITPSPGAPNPTPTSGGNGDGGGCVSEIPMLINEILVDPPGADTNKEWIEVGNPGTEPVSLAGWQVQAATTPGRWGTAFTFPDGVVIAGRGHFAIGGEESALTSGETILKIEQGSLFGNATTHAAAARLVDPSGCVADVVAYGRANRTQGDEGEEEEWGFLDREGDPILEDRLGPRPGADDALARMVDLVDTNHNRNDFVVTAEATPGAPNPDLSCQSLAGTVVINEFLANPAGPDVEAGTEFLELYNTGTEDITLTGWQVRSQTQPDRAESVVYTFLPGAVIPAGGFRVMGAIFVPEADDLRLDLNLPNGTGSDKVLLYDCEDGLADEVVYGGENRDRHVDANGEVEDRVAPRPPDDRCIGRRPDGEGVGRSVEDFTLLPQCTPGESNGERSNNSGNVMNPTGCSCDEPRDPGAPGIDTPGGPNEPTACSTLPSQRWSFVVLAGLVSLVRRRRAGASG